MRVALFFLVLTACEPPPDLGRVPDNGITGSVVVEGVAAPGPVVLFLTDAANPMPPFGTGRPFSFTTVAPHAFTGAHAGVQSAPYAFTGVPDGEWLVTGLVDMDRDFHPLVPALGGATCGDVVGGHVASLATGALAPVAVSGGELLHEVTVLLGRALTTERPAFLLPEGLPRVSRQAAIDAPGSPQGFRVEATGVHAALSAEVRYDLDGPFEPEAPAPCQAAFLARVVDADADGVPDPHPLSPQLYDIRPLVYLTWLGAPTDTDGDGAPDAFANELAPGESWAAQAVVHPQMLALGQLPPVGLPGLAPFLDLIWLPGAQHTQANGSVRTVTNPLQLPAGAWSITVVQDTGQTWTVPNALAGAAATDPSFDPLGQAGFLIVE